MKVPAVFVTHRPAVHQEMARAAAPAEVDLRILVSPTNAEVAAAVADAEFLVSERSGVIDATVIAAGRRLRLIQRLGRQYHDIDTAAAARAQIPVCVWPLPQCALVAEHVLTQILTLVKRWRDQQAVMVSGADWGPPRRCDANTFAMNWSGRDQVGGLRGMTVGIVGFGEIGTEVAVRLGPFGCRVLYHRRNRLPEANEASLGVTYASRDEVVATADVVCLLVPHSPETEGMTDAAFVASMRPGALLVSAGASTTLDEHAVAAAYASGHLGGVATDGTRWEPVEPDNPLVALARDPAANVVLTPHAAQGAIVLDAALRRPEFTNLVRTLAGQPLLHRVA